MEWYDVYIVLQNKDGDIIWRYLKEDFQAKSDKDAIRQIDDEYRWSE